MQSRHDLAKRYLGQGWIPFAYAAAFTPPKAWQQSIVTEYTLDEVSASPHPIGLLTGKRSGLVVVDVDPRNGGDTMRFLKHYGIGARDTFVVSTASPGGYHLYFRHPDGIDELPYLGNAGERLGAEVLNGVDLSSANHHVIAPPSVRVGHPSKPDGQYSVHVDEPVAELPEALLLDWLQAARPSGTAIEGVPVDQAPESDHAWMLDLHTRNVKFAADLDVNRDNGVYSRICASVRIAMALPDSVLSIDRVGHDYELGVPYTIKDLDGKLKRAVDFAELHSWKVLERENATVPDGIPERYAADVEEDLDRLRYRDRLKEIHAIEKLENAARNAVLPDYQTADAFLSKPVEHPEWIVDGLLHYRGSVLLSAQNKAGKTTLVLNLARALSSGKPLFGEYAVPQAMNVAWWDNELDDAMAHRWLSDLPDVVRERVTRVAGLGRTASMDMRSDTLRQAHARRLRELGADVLIVDPIAPILSVLGLAEEESKSVRPLLDAFDTLKVEADLKAVIITAHTGHSEKGRARGSSAFGDWTTAAWNLQLESESNHGSARVFSIPFGRDSRLRPFRLEYDLETRLLTKAATGPFADEPWQAWLVERRGDTVTAADVMAGTECSKPAALERLRMSGWVETEPARGRIPARWDYQLSAHGDPFAEPPGD